jgi:site-specific recombinase XerC
MPIKPVEARPQKDGRYRVIIPASLAGGKRKRKWFSGKGAESRAEAFAKSVEVSRIARAQHYEALNISERSEVGGWVRDLRAAFSHEWAVLGREAVNDMISRRTCARSTVGEAARECIKLKKAAGLSGRYVKNLTNNLAQFEIRFGAVDCQSVTSKDVESWLYAQPWEPYTMRSVLIDVRTLFSFALNRHYVAKNPVLAVMLPKLTRKPPCILTPDEAERLMRSAQANDPGLIPYISLILFGGLRPEEAYRCREEHVKDDHIDLPAGLAKNNRRRLIELGPLETLRAWLALKGDMPPKNVRKRMDEVRRAAQPLSWGHDILRHSFVSYGVPIWGVAQTALHADHSETVLKQHYRELVRRADAERFWKILPTAQ